MIKIFKVDEQFSDMRIDRFIKKLPNGFKYIVNEGDVMEFLFNV